MPTVTEYPSARSVISGTWNTPENQEADDGVTGSNSGVTTDAILEHTTFGFDATIPVGAIINTVTLEAGISVINLGGVTVAHNRVRLGTTDGTNNTVVIADVNSGTDGATNKSWAVSRPGGGSWTRTDLLDGTFKVRLEVDYQSGTSVYFYWDYVRVVVDYALGGNPIKMIV